MSKSTQSAYVPNSYQTPNILVDVLMPLLTPQEWIVLSFATRHILGWQDKIASRQAHISISQFMKCGLARQTILTTLDELVKYRILKKVGKPDAKGQMWELVIDGDIDLYGLDARAVERKSKKTKRTTKARSIRQTSGLSHRPVDQRSIPQTSAGLSDRPEVVYPTDTTKHNLQTQSSNTSLSQPASASATDALGSEIDDGFKPSKELIAAQVKQATTNLSAEASDKAVEPPTVKESLEVKDQSILVKDQFYITHKDTAVGPFKGFKTANDYKFARSLPGTIAQGAGIGTVAKVEPPEEKRATPDKLFSWIAVNLIKNDPQVAYDSKRMQKHVFNLMAPIVNAEKRLLKVKVLPQADRDRMAGEMAGWLTWYPTICKGCIVPQDPTKFEMYVNQWYAAGKPGSKPAVKRVADPNCPHCHGDGVVTTEDDRGYRTSKTCSCVQEARHA